MKWTLEELEIHIETNVEDYGSAVVVAALFKKLYGKFPKIGLSGAQAEFADSVMPKLPDAKSTLKAIEAKQPTQEG